ncbi:MAG: sodium:panthothenate symporter [Lentisphaerae bacterium]|nr:sodium:panthothenate symporter [Lentisphaerota bacterium]
MGYLEWAIVIIPFAMIMGMAIYSRKFIRGVSDFLVAGRVAGRYVISVAGVESALGVISLVSMVEQKYATGFAMEFWWSLMLPTSMFLSLTGFCAYRFRETKALSIGQFLEIRYSRALRIFATSLRTFAEMLCNTIGPAVAARFFIYLLGIPHTVNIFGFQAPTFMLLLAVVLVLALILILTGGQISLIVTDCVQGLMSYPIFVIFTIYILTNFSWFGEITPVMLDRADGESFINPYDVENLRDFNLFALFCSLIFRPLNQAVWYGNGTSGAGRTPHEQKMAGMLGTWRGGFSALMTLMIAICIITTMNHAHFVPQAHKIRKELAVRVADEIVLNNKAKDAVTASVSQISAPQVKEGTLLQRENNYETPFMDATRQSLLKTMPSEGEANQLFQQFRSLYNQNMLPVALKNLMPPTLLALFVLLMIMLMVSTDDSRIFASAATIVQDVIVPLRKKPFTPEQHIKLLKWMTVVVAIIFFFGSVYLSQMDYISLFTSISTSIWITGAGSVMTFGLYSRFGTTAGAFASLFSGMILAGGGFTLQRTWAKFVYPFLERHSWVDEVGAFLTAVSSPLNPYVEWVMNPVKFPINSTEIAFIATITSVSVYIIVSLITFKKPFNLDRMLHRGKYNFDGDDKKIHVKWSWKTVFSKIIGITPDYTKGDRAIAWSLFIYTFCYRFGIAFVLVAVSNIFFEWTPKMWGQYFYITHLIIPLPIAIITTVWFFIGGVIDLRRLFIDLAKRKEDYLDNGMVEGNVSLADKAAVKRVEEEASKEQNQNAKA